MKNRVEQGFYGMKFPNSGYTSPGCPNVPEKSKQPENSVALGHSYSGPAYSTLIDCFISVYIENS